MEEKPVTEEAPEVFVKGDRVVCLEDSFRADRADGYASANGVHGTVYHIMQQGSCVVNFDKDVDGFGDSEDGIEDGHGLYVSPDCLRRETPEEAHTPPQEEPQPEAAAPQDKPQDAPAAITPPLRPYDLAWEYERLRDFAGKHSVNFDDLLSSISLIHEAYTGLYKKGRIG